MRGIKDLHGLLFWLDNSKGPSLQLVLDNHRNLTRRKKNLLRELEEENKELAGRLGLRLDQG